MTKRLVSQQEAAAYLGISVKTFKKMQKVGSIPVPVPGTVKYDIRLIDEYIDRAARLANNEIAEVARVRYESTEASYEAFKASQGIT